MDSQTIPIIKPSIDQYHLEDKICFRISGNILEVEDREKKIYNILTKMNGRNTIQDIYEILIHAHQDIAYQDIYNIFSDMNEARLIEDARFTYDEILTEYEANRWSRNINFFGSFIDVDKNKYSYQKKIQDVKVTLLGLGGLGTHIIYDLVALGVKDIIAVDFDKIEISNLNRQILYSEYDVGRNKIDAAKDRIDQFYIENKVSYVQKKISSSEDIQNLIQDRNIVICVADKPTMYIQRWLNEACVNVNIPYMQGGIDVQRAVYCTVKPGTTGCTECWKSEAKNSDETYELIEKDMKTDFTISPPAPAIVTFVSILTGNMLTDFIKLVTGIAEPLSLGKLLEIPFDTMTLNTSEVWEKIEDCQVCSQKTTAQI